MSDIESFQIVIARKPLHGTVADNVTAWGVGGLNVDGCRVGTEVRVNQPASSLGNGHTMSGGNANTKQMPTPASGRWPANVILDESAGAALDAQSGWSGGGKYKQSGFRVGGKSEHSVGINGTKNAPDNYGDSGGASRFFYNSDTIEPIIERTNMHYQLLHGDNREQLKHLADNSIDSIVCDPPYELGFMGKRWDSTGIAYDGTVWTECLRVLKPGGHLIAFGGTRTYHRMTVAIEDAGFEIRDCIMWLYGSGFPKSLAIDKAIDKQRDDRAQVYQVTAWIREARDNAGLSNGDIDKAFGFHGMAGHWTSSASQPSVPTLEQIPPLLALFGMTLDDVPEDIRTLIWTLNGRKGQPGEAWYQREVVGEKWRTPSNKPEFATQWGFGANTDGNYTLTAPATDLAKQWHGWGTALKPAVEPAVLARKPLSGTVADNVTAWGVGGLNIDGCRVSLSDGESAPSGGGTRGVHSLWDYSGGMFQKGKRHTGNTTPASGRWPANVILDESAGEALDEQSGERKSGGRVRHNKMIAINTFSNRNPYTGYGYSDSGGASRFFYTAKASKAEREAGLDGMEIKNNMRVNAPRENEEEKHATHRANHHPTVKPIALMRYLVRLVTPKDGTVLDPFMGSGSTGCAAMCEGVNFVGIELSEEYLEIARRRIEYWQSQNPMGL